MRKKIHLHLVFGMVLLITLGAFLIWYLMQSPKVRFEACIIDTSESSLLIYKSKEEENRFCYVSIPKNASQKDREGFTRGAMVRVKAVKLVQYLGTPVYSEVIQITHLGYTDEALLAAGQTYYNKL